MPLPWTTEIRDAQRARRRASAWLLDIYTVEATLRIWDQRIPIEYESETYEAQAGKWGVEGEIKTGNDLVPQPLVLWIDEASQSVDGSLTERFLTSTWHLRPIRLRQICMVPNTNFTQAVGVSYTWIGFIETIDIPMGNDQTKIMINCESGTFRAKGREMHTVTDADQRIRDPDDGSFANLATKSFQDIPFGESWVNVPGSPAAEAAAASQASRAAAVTRMRNSLFRGL